MMAGAGVSTVGGMKTLEGVKAKQQKTWASGDYGAVAAIIHATSEALVQAADLSAGSRVLDVAAGTGNASLAAARCLCDVTATDYVPELLERARARAAAERLPLTCEVADAENLPFADGSFDAVLSVFGVMFAPDHDAAAAELTRVCRPGGTVALANWTPDGFIGQVFRTIARHVPPPAGVRPPPLWGDEAHLRDLFGDRVTDLRITARDFVFRFGEPEGFANFFATNYGPTLKAVEALGENGTALRDDLAELAAKSNVATDGTVKIPSAYVEVLAYRA